MKTDFSSSWNSSVQVRKQRKFRFNAPLHIKHKFLSAHLSKPLRQKYGKRSLPLRTGDEVLVMRGSFKKKTAKVLSVDKLFNRVTLEGIQRSKRDGSKVAVPFNPRALQISKLVEDDKFRIEALNRKAPVSAPKTSKPKSGAKNASN